MGRRLWSEMSEKEFEEEKKRIKKVQEKHTGSAKIGRLEE